MRDEACVITGVGTVSALGLSCRQLLASIEARSSGIGEIQRFSTAAFESHIGAEVAWEGAQEDGARCMGYALKAAKEAWQQSGLEAIDLDGERLAVVCGTSLAGLQTADGEVATWKQGEPKIPVSHSLTVALAEAFGALGPRVTWVNACAASTGALGYARELLRQGVADVVLAGGADVLTLPLFAGFHNLGLVSPTPSAPFSTQLGMSLGEGAGLFVLESQSHASRRGARGLGYIRGVGSSCDAFHLSSPDPSGRGIARSIAQALDDGGCAPEDIDYYCAHGTGTEANDAAEWQAVLRVFGDAPQLALSAPKSFLGHAQGAAGGLEAAVVCLAMEHGFLPPTLHFGQPRTVGPTWPVPHEPRPAKIDHALTHNSAFGGSNVTLLLSREAGPRRSLHHSAPLAILGVGAAEGREGIAKGLATWARRVDPKALDPGGQMLCVAAAQALSQAGVKVRGGLREQVGLMVGVNGFPPQSAFDYTESLKRRGLTRSDPHAFSRSVLNAACGQVATALSLRGPHAALSGPAAGIQSVLFAAQHLRVYGQAQMMLTGGVDELHGPLGLSSDEGAYCALLARPEAAPATPLAWLLDVGLLGPSGSSAALQMLLQRAEATPTQVFVCLEPDGPDMATWKERCQRALGPRWCGSWHAFEPRDRIASASCQGLLAAIECVQEQQGMLLMVGAHRASCSYALILQSVEGALDGTT